MVSYFNKRSNTPGHCLECGYNLTGLPGPRCPECGSPFDPEEVYSSQENSVVSDNELPGDINVPGDGPVLISPAQEPHKSSSNLGDSFPFGIAIVFTVSLGVIAYCAAKKPEAIFAIVGVGALFLLGFLLRRSVPLNQQEALVKQKYCQYCGCKLLDISEPQCPECGVSLIQESGDALTIRSARNDSNSPDNL